MVRLSLLTLQLPLFRKFFGTSATPRYDLLNDKQRAELKCQACQPLTCTVEWANDTSQRSNDLAWQITPRDSTCSTSTVTLALRETRVIEQSSDWHVEAIFAGFRARIRGPIRVRLSRGDATGDHVLLNVTVSDMCWHSPVSPFICETKMRDVSELGKLAEYYHEPQSIYCLTLPADISATPATPELALTFRTVTQMTELLKYDQISAMIANVVLILDAARAGGRKSLPMRQPRLKMRCSMNLQLCCSAPRIT